LRRNADHHRDDANASKQCGRDRLQLGDQVGIRS
jgi:hypothetical protein